MIPMTPVRSRRLITLSSALALALTLAACGGETSPQEPSGAVGSPTATPSTSAASAPQGTPNQSPAASSSTAPTAEQDDSTSTMAVFEDFACPHCKTFHQQYGGFLSGLDQDGEVDLEYRIVDFLGRDDPESWSTRAANAYYCFSESADDSGLTHAYQSRLFESAPEGLDDDQLVEQAAQMDQDIQACVAEDGGTEQIQRSLGEMADAQLRGVPSITVDGTAYDPQTDGELHAWVLASAGVED